MSHIQPDDIDDDLVATYDIGTDKGKQPDLSGRIGGSSAGPSLDTTTRQVIGGVNVERRVMMDTLDEPLSTTILRDVNAIGTKIVQVLNPTSSTAVLREWDLWGPLVFSLALAVGLSWGAPPDQSLSLFTGVFVIISIGSVLITLNAKLLGGRVSFFQSLCVLGYCIFPLNVSSIVCLFVRKLYVRAPVCIVTLLWSLWASVNFLEGTRLEKDRSVLAVFPLFMLFFLLSWMVMLS